MKSPFWYLSFLYDNNWLFSINIFSDWLYFKIFISKKTLYQKVLIEYFILTICNYFLTRFFIRLYWLFAWHFYHFWDSFQCTKCLDFPNNHTNNHTKFACEDRSYFQSHIQVFAIQAFIIWFVWIYFSLIRKSKH